MDFRSRSSSQHRCRFQPQHVDGIDQTKDAIVFSFNLHTPSTLLPSLEAIDDTDQPIWPPLHVRVFSDQNSMASPFSLASLKVGRYPPLKIWHVFFFPKC
jgi:hypothetical protein